MVVDDAIVVVENTQRWLAEGLSSKAAAKTMEEVHRAGHRNDPGADGGVCPGCDDAGHYRQNVQPICRRHLYCCVNFIGECPDLITGLIKVTILRPPTEKEFFPVQGV